MFITTRRRLVRAAVLGGLTALVLSTHVFVTADRLRVKLVDGSPIAATSGLVGVTTGGFSPARELQLPFALIARVRNQSSSTAELSIAVDGVPACERALAPGSQRLDCTVSAAWDPLVEHFVAIQGPMTMWTLESLELSTHHGNTSGLHYLLVLPAASDHYARPPLGWVVATWLLITAILIVPAPLPPRRWIQAVYWAVAGLIVLELTICVASELVSPYRLVLQASTFTTWLAFLLAPRLWAVCRAMAQMAASHLNLEAVAALGLFLSAIAASHLVPRQSIHERTTSDQIAAGRRIQRDLADELRPVVLDNCTLQRFGGPNDGGYLMCSELVKDAAIVYSYGIANEDSWGCDVSRTFRLPVHQYDCFDTRPPVCAGGRFTFHAECIGGNTATIDSRPFDTLSRQIARNGDTGKSLLVKIDVEGAEWMSLLATPDSVLDRIEQLPMELHGTDDSRFVDVVRKLKRTFYVAHIHFNNMACNSAAQPFPSYAFQVLFVNKRLGKPAMSRSSPTLPHAADAPDNPSQPDCQQMVR